MAEQPTRRSRSWRAGALGVALFAVAGCAAADAHRENATGKQVGGEQVGKVWGAGKRRAAPTTTAAGELQAAPVPTTAAPATTAAAPVPLAASTTSAPVPAPAPAPAPQAGIHTPTGPTLSVVDFGAVPDDGRDDQAAIQNAIDAAAPGTTVVFPAGTYHHSALLQVRAERVTLWGYGASVIGTNREKHAIVLWGDYTSVVGLTVSANPTGRLHAEDQMGISLHYTKGSVVRDVTVRNTSSAGIFIWGSTDYQIVNNVVENTMSDGIHSVGGARNGLVQGNRLRNVGDDCFAVISYISERRMSGNITIRDNSCVGGKARGISVVGGEDVLIENNTIEASAAAGIYLASEPNYNTYAAHRVQVRGNRLLGVNTNSAIRHGAIFLWARAGSETTSDGVRHSLQNEDILIRDNEISGTVNGAANVVAQGSDTLRVNFVGNHTSGGRHAYLELRRDQYNQIGEVDDGQPVADYVGNASIVP
jgi:polygalacturonase